MRQALFAPGSRSSIDIETGFWIRDRGDNRQGVSEDFTERFALLRERTHEGHHWRQLRGTSIGIALSHMAFLRNRILPEACTRPGNLAAIQQRLESSKPAISPQEYDTENLEWEFEPGGENHASKAKWIGYDKLFQSLLTARCPCADSNNPARLKVFIDDLVREFDLLARKPALFGDVEVDQDPIAPITMTVSEEEMREYFLDEDRPSLVELLEFSAIINEIGHTFVFQLIIEELFGKESDYVREHREEQLAGSMEFLGKRLAALHGTSYLRPLAYVSKVLGVELEAGDAHLRTLLAIGLCIDVALNPALPPAVSSRFGTYITLTDFDAAGRLGILLARNRETVLDPDFKVSLESAKAYRAKLARSANITWTDEEPTLSLPDSLFGEYLTSLDREDCPAEPWAQGSRGLFLINSLVYEGLLRMKLHSGLGYLSDDVFGFRYELAGNRLRMSNILADEEFVAKNSHIVRFTVPIAQFSVEDGTIGLASGMGWSHETCFVLMKLTCVLDATYDIMRSGEITFLRGAPGKLAPVLDAVRKMVRTYYGVA
jgi:hypothetical protein